jgi:ABC-type transport system involved in multi-copper enzyme maturation permease subunit
MPIFDQGYQHWQGQLSGHGWRWLAVARHGVRAQLKSWIVRLLLLLAWLPALALVSLLTLWGLLEQQAESAVAVLSRLLPPDVIAKPQDFRGAIWTIAYSYFFKAELICSLFLVLVVGPNLVSRDLRFNALPLYLSRPVRRIDYFLGKLAIIGFYLLATVVLPAVGAYLLGLAFSLDLAVVRDTWRLLFAGVLYGVVITVCSGTLMLALSSLSRRSIYVGLAWAGLVFLSHMLGTALISVQSATERREIVQDGISKWVKENPPPPGIQMQGPFPRSRYVQPRPGQPDEKVDREQRERDQWMREWSAEWRELNQQAEEKRLSQAAGDWRPVLSYAVNLDRLGDWLLDTDAAWVTLGRALEAPRQMAGAMMPRDRRGPATAAPTFNERRLADRMVWQYPWYWSAATLGGIWLLSVFVLSRRVKSLDRLK